MNKEIREKLIKNNPSETAWQVSRPIFNCIIKIGKEIINRKGDYAQQDAISVRNLV